MIVLLLLALIILFGIVGAIGLIRHEEDLNPYDFTIIESHE